MKISLSANKLCLIIVAAFGILIFTLNSCHQPTKEEQDTADGELLARKYCVSCHQLPDPALIDRKSWVSGVLPAMAKQLRVQNYMGQYFADKQSLISTEDWQKIFAYYKNTSPVDLPIPKQAVAPEKDWAIFTAIQPKKVDTTGQPAMTTFTGFDPEDHKIYTADAASNLFEWDKDLNFRLVKRTESPVTGMIFPKTSDNKNIAVITTIGVLPPLDIAKGKVVQMDLNGSKDSVLIGDGLPRAVQSVAADFNKDGLTDYVVCGFGHTNGGLYLLQTASKSSI